MRVSSGALLALAIAAAIASPRPARAEVDATTPRTRPPLELREVLESAERAHPKIASAMAELAGAQASELSAAGGFDPTLRATAGADATGQYPNQRLSVQATQATPLWGAQLFAGYRYGGGKFAVYDGKLETNDHGEVRGGVRVPILRDGSIDERRAKIRTSEIGVRVASFDRDRQRLEILRSAGSRYWDWVAAGHKRAIAKRWLELAERRDAQIVQRVASGDLPELEHQENLRAIHRRRAVLALADREVAVARADLSIFYRDREGAPIEVSDDALPPLPDAPATVDVDAARATAIALRERPELARAELSRSRARVDRELASNARLPGVDVTLAGSQDLGAGDPARGRPVLEALVMLDIPTLNRSARGQVRKADAELRKADADVQLTRDQISAEARAAVASLRGAVDSAHAAVEERRVADALAEAEARRFLLGEGTLLLVNLREQNALEAEVRAVEAAAEVGKSKVRLAATLGRPHAT